MRSTGILIHVHHLGTADWEGLLWGNPATDSFGSLATVVYVLLTAPNAQHINTIIVGCGPSGRNDMTEAEYTIHQMVAYFDRLSEFKRLRPLLAALTPQQHDQLREKIKHIIPTPQLRNTAAEVRISASMFAERGITTIYEVCSASHAPRCIQTVAQARAEGAVPREQLWLTVATDTCFAGAMPDDTIVLEPPHRGDDGTHNLPKALKPVVRMPATVKEQLADVVADFVKRQDLN